MPYLKSLAGCLLALACASTLTKAQAQDTVNGSTDYQLKTPYAGKSMILLRQVTAALNSNVERPQYFEIYQLNLNPMTQSQKPCYQQADSLLYTAKTDLNHYWKDQLGSDSEDIAKTPVEMVESTCTDLNQDQQPEMALRLTGMGHFGNRHSGIFLYHNSLNQHQSLMAKDTPFFHGDHLMTRPTSTNNGWPDLIGMSYTQDTLYIQPFRFGETEGRYLPSTLHFWDTESVYNSQNQPLAAPDFNASSVQNTDFVLNREGSLVGLIHKEAAMYTSWSTPAIMVIEPRSGRTEQVYLESADKSVVQGLKRRFPKYFQQPGFAQFTPQVLGFDKDQLIFKLDMWASCLDMPDNKPPCKGHTPHFPNATPIETLYPNQFAGYWAYHYRTGALKLISWNSQAAIHVEHTGYPTQFQRAQ